MKIKRIIYSFYQELQYNLARIKNKANCGKKDCNHGRDVLMKYSPKPTGYYKNMRNLPVVDGLALSIIVPMYNVEKYIAECLTSIIHNDTHYSYEVLCIDDGSKDESAAIAEAFTKKYPNIKVIRQQNRGIAGARNRGLDEAGGSYVMFLDGDDVIEVQTIECMMDKAEKNDLDVVSCGFYTFNNEKRNLYIEKECLEKEHVFEVMRKYPCYYCMKVIRRSIFQDMRLPEGFLFEDMQVLFVITKLCKGFAYIPKALYGYRQNPEGISATSSCNPRAVDQYWLTEYISDEYNRRYWKKDTTYCKAMLRELSIYMYRRTKNLPLEIREALFTCAADQVADWMLEINALTKGERRALRAFQKKDFEKWELASRFFY